MEIIRFAFYKPPKGDFWGQLISLWTGLFNWGTPGYSHVEIGFRIEGKWEYYSSASRNTSGESGTRWLDEETLFKNPDRWDVWSVEAIRPQADMIADCNAELGKEYDWLGIYGFTTLFGLINSADDWYCSEICYYIFFGRWRKRVSPRRLYSEIHSYIALIR